MSELCLNYLYTCTFPYFFLSVLAGKEGYSYGGWTWTPSLSTAQWIFLNGYRIYPGGALITQLTAAMPTTVTSNGGVFYANKASGVTVTMSGSTLTANSVTGAGGIAYAQSSSVTFNFTGNTLIGNNASAGGVFTAVNSTTSILLQSCTVTGNAATMGGAVVADYGGGQMLSIRITDHNLEYIFLTSYMYLLSYSYIRFISLLIFHPFLLRTPTRRRSLSTTSLLGISTVSIGGGIYQGNAVVNSNTNVPSYGGVAYFENTKASLTVAGAQFNGNSAGGGEGYGGVAYFLGGAASVLVSGSNFSSNSAGLSGDGYGGVLYFQGGAYGVNISRSVFEDNRCVRASAELAIVRACVRASYELCVRQ